jgi:hypothetical protein
MLKLGLLPKSISHCELKLFFTVRNAAILLLTILQLFLYSQINAQIGSCQTPTSSQSSGTANLGGGVYHIYFH